MAAWGRDEGGVTVVSLVSGETLADFETRPGTRNIRFDRQGHRLAFHHSDGLQVWDLRTGRSFADSLRASDGFSEGAYYESMGFTPDGAHFYATSGGPAESGI